MRGCNLHSNTCRQRNQGFRSERDVRVIKSLRIMGFTFCRSCRSKSILIAKLFNYQKDLVEKWGQDDAAVQIRDEGSGRVNEAEIIEDIVDNYIIEESALGVDARNGRTHAAGLLPKLLAQDKEARFSFVSRPLGPLHRADGCGRAPDCERGSNELAAGETWRVLEKFRLAPER
jgi:hypothetical protein